MQNIIFVSFVKMCQFSCRSSITGIEVDTNTVQITVTVFLLLLKVCAYRRQMPQSDEEFHQFNVLLKYIC